ncbi:phage portal protein [Anaerotignum propionicum]|uniref:Phage portal protein, SPP1 Gp6-like n=1 Tax=Anaerotignum propionicum DSM 1682 TaxID=991789 RepID=A0A0X8V930_ANAPI|nr:phage portal protein [Anaerotignum propionicum]AMJ40371.1 phage portal protein, SPP1 Gp6-like [Anaerotignum propionicum DSM 1682]SHE43904.1 phage portal protein, putative, A118 family [[Clostridium] propionicum DSM 1682] [Anaerotignum propionicum DSM 1682]
MQAILQYLSREGYDSVDNSYYAKIALWLSWYKGKVVQFHNYRQYNGMKKINRTRKTLGMAKKVCEDWANLELNEKVSIVIDNQSINNAVHDVLEANNFRIKGNQLLEIAYALGTGAFVEYLDGEKICIDYIRASMIYPLQWDNGEILSCAFASERVNGKKKLVYLNIHERQENGFYIIKNRMFERNGNNLTAVELPEGLVEEYNTGSSVPWFQVITPNIVNNVDLDCPMGVSVYANAIDQLEGVDLVYDSYLNEFRLGKKRIIVPNTMARMMIEDSGTVGPLFDDNDTEFYSLGIEGEENQKIQEINMEIRADAHEKAISRALSLLSDKCGLGEDRYKFENSGLKTATEVVSEKSELYQNLRKHELILEGALIHLVKAIATMLGYRNEIQVTINFDDSIIEDTAAEKQQFLQEIRDGIRQRWEYRVRFFGETEEEAKVNVTDSQSNNMLMGFGDE